MGIAWHFVNLGLDYLKDFHKVLLLHGRYVTQDGKSPVIAENWANAAIADVGVSMTLAVTADFKNRGYFYYDADKDDAVLHYPKSLEADATNAVRAINDTMARVNWQRLGAPGFDDVIFARGLILLAVWR